tara:strand:- start:573330 stop:574376 length:1047 start_codon:yes stop_codon:yes gene_type:complete
MAGCPLSGVPVVPVATDASITESHQTPSLDVLVADTLDANLQKRWLSTETHGAWQVLHGILAYGRDFNVRTANREQPAVSYLLAGGSLAGFQPRPGDPLGSPPRRGLRLDIDPATKVGQGHYDQWLAVMLQSGLDADTEIQVGEATFTMLDWLNQAEYDVPLNLELEFSWTMIALVALHETTHQWVARDGEQYSTEFLLELELDQDLESSVCGGTHRLIGAAMALNKRRQEGRPITGVWQQADDVIQAAIEAAKLNQNADGSFSIAYLHRPGWTRDLGETLGTTGHVLEFLAIAAPDETLRQPWVERSVRRVCAVLTQCEDVELECGVLYHALHGLAEYQKRMQPPTR